MTISNRNEMRGASRKRKNTSYDSVEEADDNSNRLTEVEDGVVAAVVENRGREVCICWISRANVGYNVVIKGRCIEFGCVTYLLHIL